MKKPLITLLVVFAIAFGIFATAEIRKIDTNAAIAKAPVFVVATPDGITKKTKKGRTSFQVNYSYAVSGAQYKIDTKFFSTEEEALAMAAQPVQVAFAASNPNDAVFKSEFDQRDPNAGMSSALTSAAGFGLVASLVVTLVLLWKFPWLRRA